MWSGRDPEEPYDLIVVGADPLGVAAARDAAVRGLSVLVVDEQDVAASSAPGAWPIGLGGGHSSSFRERAQAQRLLEVAPHLTRAVPALSLVPGLGALASIRLSSALLARRAYERSQTARPEKLATKLDRPALAERLPGVGDSYDHAVAHEAWTLDVVRFCLGLMVDARDCGASFRLRSEHEITHRPDGLFELRGRHLATDHPSDALARALLVTGSGTHASGLGVEVAPVAGESLVVLGLERRLTDSVVVLPSTGVVAVPDGNVTTVYGRDDGGTAEAVSSKLWRAISDALPLAMDLPVLELRREKRVPMSAAPAVVDHVRDGRAGLWSAVGTGPGAALDAAGDIIDAVSSYLGLSATDSARTRALPGSPTPDRLRALAERYGVPEPVLSRLQGRYGARMKDVLVRLNRHPEERATVCSCEAVIESEVVHACEVEDARSLSDVTRRTCLGRGPCGALRCAHRGAQVAARVRGGRPKAAIAEAVELLRERASMRTAPGQGPLLRQEELLRSYAASVGIEVWGKR